MVIGRWQHVERNFQSKLWELKSFYFAESSRVVCHIRKEKQRGCPQLGTNKYTHTYISDIIYLFETIVSKAWPSSSVFFKIINIIFPGVSISWILKVFRFILGNYASILKTLIIMLATKYKTKNFQYPRDTDPREDYIYNFKKD